MKFSAIAVLATALPAACARFTEQSEVNNVILYPDGAEAESYLIELAPGETRKVTEEEKWELRRVSGPLPQSRMLGTPKMTLLNSAAKA